MTGRRTTGTGSRVTMPAKPPTRTSSESWIDQAACAEIGGDLWFPAPEDRPAKARAIAICKTCPVRKECLDYAITNKVTAGIWGGRTARSRVGERGEG